jgi:hypothetical protein
MMQHANARFEREQPSELRRIPFAIDDMQMVPCFMEVLGWIFLAFCVGILFIGFLGL